MALSNLSPLISKKFGYQLTDTVKRSEIPDAKHLEPNTEVSKIEKLAMSMGWKTEQLWATGETNYNKVSPFEFLKKHGGKIVKVTSDYIVIKWENVFSFFYRKQIPIRDSRGIATCVTK